MDELLQEAAGVSFDNGYIWLYGDASSRATPFEPHENLDGLEFSSWEDDVLGNDLDWPPYSHFFPGDHETCQCQAARTISGDIGDEVNMTDEPIE